MKLKKLVIAPALILLLGVLACSSGKVIAASSLAAVQTAVDSYLALYAPTWSGTPTLNKAFSQAIADVAAWKSGSVGTEVETALSDVAAALDNIPQISGQTDQAIGAAVNFVDNLITIVQSESATNVSDQGAVFYAWLETDKAPASSATRKHRWHGKQIKTVKQFKSAWNKSVAKGAQIQ